MKKSSFLRNFTVIFYLLFNSLFIVAQDFNNIIPPAPDAYSLSKYSEIPVSLYTGTPDINIPLYQITGRKISLPISLSYHAGGFKVDEIASWVGLGWSLNAGGIITRSVRGLPDEEGIYGYFYSQLFDNGDFQQTDNFYNYNPDDDFLRLVADGDYDTEPDIFSYNFNGFSGQFYFNGSGNLNDPVVLVPHRQLNFKITNSSFEEWVITVEDGTKYIFGTDDAIETTHIPGAYRNVTIPDYISSWYLRYIISPNNEDTISFIYSVEAYSYALQQGEELLYDLYPKTFITENRISRGINLYGQRLNTIESVNTKIILDGSARDDLPGYPKLKTMTICTRDGTDSLKQYVFCTDYFGSGYGSGTSSRLKLTHLLEVHSSDTASKYEFIYNTQELPNRLSKQQDHWGFYNGATGNDNPSINSLIPTMEFGDVTIDGADREPNTTLTKACILTKIIYPTGGYTEFEYEAHDYRYINISEQSENKQAGGVRIKKITDYNGISHDNDIVRKFNYRMQSNPAKSSGVLLYTPKYFQYMDLENGIVHPAPDYSTTYVKLFASSTVPLTSNQGGHIGYREVEVVYGVNGENGSERIKFKSSIDHPDQYPASYTFPIPLNESYDWKRGLETEKLTFNKDLNTVKKITSSYNSIDDQRNRNTLRLFNCMYSWRGTFIYSGVVYSTDQAEFIYGSAKVISAWNYMNSQSKTEYFPGGNLQNTIQYLYQNAEHSQLTKMVTTTSDNNRKEITYYKYPHDNVSWLSSNIRNRMRDRNMINTFIEKEIYSKKEYPNDSILINGERRFYGFDIVGSDTLIYLDSIQYNHKEGASPYLTRLYYDKRDSYGNISQYHKSDDHNISYVWGYSNSLPIVQAENANHGELLYEHFEEGNLNGWWCEGFLLVNRILNDELIDGNKILIINNGKYALKILNDANFDFEFGVKYKATIRGKCISSTSNNPALKIVNNGVGYSKSVPKTDKWELVTLEFTYNGGNVEVYLDADLGSNDAPDPISFDNLRIYPTDARVIAYTYNPLAGMKSETDPNSLPTYYEYDDFGRLQKIKDHNGYILREYNYHYKEQ